ncbi:hypothetical protein HaLaN_21492 [Haematococcus lacustris]|uniref:Uncharacterized protein n=1 Tax=Haematococcus lacustris TaxID=44745 RepID=A0A699ZRN6_HAELA|nr:hypothetical protein HaLaN_21492 [Haematococcus lacustris]
MPGPAPLSASFNARVYMMGVDPCRADSPLACTRQGAGLGCSLRHAVAHACLSGEAEVLQTLMLELGFRQAVYTTALVEPGSPFSQPLMQPWEKGAGA